MAAIGVCAASLAVLREGSITEVTQRGSRIDYWLDDQRAILEVSGMWKGEASDIEARHREKARQLRASGLFRQGKPGYVFVVLFEGRVAHISHLRP